MNEKKWSDQRRRRHAAKQKALAEQAGNPFCQSCPSRLSNAEVQQGCVRCWRCRKQPTAARMPKNTLEPITIRRKPQPPSHSWWTTPDRAKWAEEAKAAEQRMAGCVPSEPSEANQ